MSLTSTTSRVDYTGNGAVDTYSYTFRILDDDHLKVTVRDTSDVETVLTKTTHYTVTGVGESAGGTVALVNGAFDWLDAEGDLESGFILTIRRVLPVKQETDLRNQGSYYPESVEDALDYLTMVSQHQQDELDRSLKYPETDTGESTLLPTVEERASKFLAFDADGEPVAAAAATGAVVSSFMETVMDDTTAAAARTTLGFTGASGTVATGNIEDGALSADASGRAKMADSFVNAAKIEALAVTGAKLNSNVADASTLELSGSALRVKDLGITQAKLAARATGTTVAAGGVAISPELGAAGSYTTSSGTPATVTGSTLVITTTGRPVMLVLQSYSSATGFAVSGTGAWVAILQFTRAAAAINGWRISSGVSGAGELSGSAVFIDTPTAGTHTYTLQMAKGAGTDVTLASARMIAFEM